MGKGAKAVLAAMMGISFLCGIGLLIFGIRDTVRLNAKAENYETTEGYLCDFVLDKEGTYDSVKQEQTSDTYRLIYQYRVDGQEYTVSTDSGTSIVPAIGSTRKISYNPNAPEDAWIVGATNNVMLLFGGILFTGVPLVFLIVFLSVSGYLRKISIDLPGVVISILVLTVSCGALYLITGRFSIKGIFEYYTSSFTPLLLIPLLMSISGVSLLIKSLFFTKAPNQKKKAERK